MLKLIQQALTSLDPFDQNITATYYGLNGPPYSPESVRQSHGVEISDSKEMILSVLRRLRHPRLHPLLVKAFRLGEQQLWEAIANADGIIYKEDLSLVRREIPGPLLLCIECHYRELQNWLTEFACEQELAWYRSPYPAEVIVKLIARLESMRDELCLPTPIDVLSGQLEVDRPLLRLALSLSSQFQIYHGYAAKQSPRSRAIRTIRLHKLMSGGGKAKIHKTHDLHREYRQIYEDDACRMIDLTLIMREATHLFLPLNDFGWTVTRVAAATCLEDKEETGISRSNMSRKKDSPFFKWSETRAGRPETTLVQGILDVLESQGPVRLLTLEKELNKKFPTDEAKGLVFAPLLANMEEVARLAPHIYGIHGRDDDLDRRPVPLKLMLTRGSCRIYVQARNAGEPMTAFPYWTATMEQEWCLWAESHASSELFQSLLWIAKPDQWPIGEGFRAIWQWKKECLALYRLAGPLRHPIHTRLPNAADLLLVLRQTAEVGSMNWIRANRIIGERILNQGVLAIMALLISLGILVPASHWQLLHPAGTGFQEVDDMLSSELQRQGFLCWHQGAARRVLERISSFLPDTDLGWVNRHEFETLLLRLVQMPSA
jgi:hypothetical protein